MDKTLMDKEFKILVVEDYEDDAELMMLELKNGGLNVNCRIVENEASYSRALGEDSWDAIISDYNLPDFDAFKALKILQQMNLDIPFIIVSGAVGEETAVRIMKAGAHDFIMKNNLYRLIPALEREIREAGIRHQRKHSELMLRRQEILLRSVVDILPVGLVLIDNQKEIILSNKEFKMIWGDISSFNSGLEDITIRNSDNGKSLKKEQWPLIRAVNEGKKSLNEIIDIDSSNGVRRTVLNSSVPVVNLNGSVEHAIMICQDITKLKKDEKRLKQALSELERSNKELEQFAYIASHDLQEPLRMISSFTQLLAKRYQDKLDPAASEFIQYAVTGAKRMQQLINDLMNYSRMTTYNKTSEHIDCNKLLTSLLNDMDTDIKEASAKVTFDSLPLIRANEMQLKQLFRNLVTNAIKFRKVTEPPEIHIHSELHYGKWLFSIQDNGIGISPLYHDKIFTIFQRLHDREKYSGTGIGLALCKKIIEQLGGSIWVESEEGKGATFFFTIPQALDK